MRANLARVEPMDAAGADGQPARAAVAPFPARLRDNPYCELLYRHVAALGVPVAGDARLEPDWLARRRDEVGVLHLHWPEFYYRNPDGSVSARSLGAFMASIVTALGLGYRIVWTVHNARPHEPRHADRLVRALLLRAAAPVVHCEAARSSLGAAAARATVIPHGSYAGWYRDDVSRDEARARLGLPANARVLLAFGQIRPYKALAPLLHAVRTLDAPDVHLVVAGRPADAATGDALERLVGELADRRLHLHLGHVPDDEVQLYFRACDLVVLPYRRILTSGAAMLALTFGRGLVVPRLGCLGELEDDGCALAFDANDDAALVATLAAALETDPTALGVNARRRADRLGWDGIAAAYARVYAGALAA